MHAATCTLHQPIMVAARPRVTWGTGKELVNAEVVGDGV